MIVRANVSPEGWTEAAALNKARLRLPQRGVDIYLQTFLDAR